MFLLLSFLLSSRAGTCALPILLSRFSEASIENPVFDVTTTASTGACAGRSLWDILWSCLATTFACTWVSVHPNIPFVRERKMSIRLWRIYLMLLSLIAPEIMILWAFKQLQGALVIKQTVNEAIDNAVNQKCQGVNSTDKGNINKSSKKSDNSNKDDPQQWTLTHAHYLQMGGFRLQCLWDDEKKIVPSKFGRKITEIHGGKKRDIWELPLSFETMKALINSDAIDLPPISKEEILDKCGRDELSKTLALLQLTWFIIQIAARARQSLAVTELELTTAALASLNIAMYISWWSKPTDILCPTTFRSKQLDNAIRIWRLRKMEDAIHIRRRSASFPLPGFAIPVISDTSLFPPFCKECKVYHAFHPSPGAGVFGGTHIGDKKRVNLVTHYCSELRAALAELAKAILESPVTIVTAFFVAICEVGKRIHDIWAKISNRNPDHRPVTIQGKIGRTFYLLWQAVAHIFLALTYYPILAILGSGKKSRPKRDDQRKTVSVKNKKPITAKDVEDKTTIQLIFNKYDLRFVMDMVFFCEDVASAPFSCLSALSGAIFGMIHCLAWNFDFPSHVEQILWRTCSSVIAGLCVCIMAIALGYIIYQNPCRGTSSESEDESAGKSGSPHERASSGDRSKLTSSDSPGEPTSSDNSGEPTSSESSGEPTSSERSGEHASPEDSGGNSSPKTIIGQNSPRAAPSEGKKESTEKTGSPDERTSSGDQSKLTSSKSPGKNRSSKIIEIVCSIFAICFVLTRISLISLSIIQLRALPASAFETVQWSGFIPHI